MATLVLVQLAAYTGDDRYAAAAEAALQLMAEDAATMPLGFAQWLVALDLYLAPPVEVAIVGEDVAEPGRAVSTRHRPLGLPAARGRGGRDRRGGARRGLLRRATPHRAQAGRRQARGLRLPSLRLRRAGQCGCEGTRLEGCGLRLS